MLFLSSFVECFIVDSMTLNTIDPVISSRLETAWILLDHQKAGNHSSWWIFMKENKKATRKHSPLFPFPYPMGVKRQGCCVALVTVGWCWMPDGMGPADGCLECRLATSRSHHPHPLSKCSYRRVPLFVSHMLDNHCHLYRIIHFPFYLYAADSMIIGPQDLSLKKKKNNVLFFYQSLTP